MLDGVMLLAGALTRVAAGAGGVVMIVLVLGATSIEHFSAVGEQLLHAMLLAVVVARNHSTYFDRLVRAGADERSRVIR